MSDLSLTLARWRVPLGFLCGAAVIWLARPTPQSMMLGFPIAAAGEALRIWAAGHLEKGREVTCSGPYRITHHPLYLGSAIVGLGCMVAAGSLGVAALIAAYLAATILSAIRTEESNMRAAFGEQYEAYLQSRGTPVDRPFSLRRALRNREHRAVIGLTAVAMILAAKAAIGSGLP